MIEQTIQVDRIEDVISVFGSFDQNLRLIESEYGVHVTDRDAKIHITGEPEAVMEAQKALNGLLQLAAKGEEITAILPKTEIVRTPSGRAKRRYALLFGKNRLNFGQTSGIPDADCDIMYHEMVCAIPGVFRLPVSIVCETRQPVTETPRARTAPEARAVMERALRRLLLERIGPDGEIMDLYFTPGETEDAFLLTLRAECEQEITTERKPAHDRTDDTG